MKKSKCPKILFLDILTDDKQAKKRIETTTYEGNTYAECTRGMLGLQKIQLISVDAAHNILPDPNDFDAIIMGGSRHNPVAGEEKPWIKRTYRFIRAANKQDIPILGICGGLQFTVRALGGKIIYNPRGREFGSIKISLTKDGLRDPLFAGLPKNIIVQLTHRCMAKNLQPGWKLLASSKLCPIQGIAIGDNIRLLQFHPEMTAPQLKSLARMRKDIFLNEGFIKDDKDFKTLLSSIISTNKTGRRILKNFITHFVMPHHASQRS